MFFTVHVLQITQNTSPNALGVLVPLALKEQLRQTLHPLEIRVGVRGADLFAHSDRTLQDHHGVFFAFVSTQHLRHVIERRGVFGMIRPERRLLARERFGVQREGSVDVILRQSTPREIV